MGCRWPRRGPGAGSVRSSHSASRRASQGGFVELPLAGFERRFELLLGGVEQLADARALLGRELAHVLADLGQRAFAAQHFDAHGFQLLGRAGGGDARQGTGLQLLYGLIGHGCGVFHCSKRRKRNRGARATIPACYSCSY